jgi:hypothetical protein
MIVKRSQLGIISLIPIKPCGSMITFICLLSALKPHISSFFGTAGVELRASCLLGRCSTSWAYTPLAFSALAIFWIGFHIFAWGQSWSSYLYLPSRLQECATTPGQPHIFILLLTLFVGPLVWWWIQYFKLSQSPCLSFIPKALTNFM